MPDPKITKDVSETMTILKLEGCPRWAVVKNFPNWGHTPEWPGDYVEVAYLSRDPYMDRRELCDDLGVAEEWATEYVMTGHFSPLARDFSRGDGTGRRLSA